ncbi:MAG TPA: 5'-nucleotidase C-terminal domain-containing protein [Gemmatirosa sp.]|nr:5'-nucleotidase C-terminal domain-containing protein [Gemmatirosa sp.]
MNRPSSRRRLPRLVHGAVAGLGALVTLAVPAPDAGAQGAAPDTLDLVVAATTDTHGRLRGWDYFAARPDPVHSLARAATVVDSLRRAAPGRVVTVDAGDLLQGTPLTYVAARVAPTERPHPVSAAMNAVGYDAAAVGNHEFNYGLDTFLQAAGEARFPFLAANAYRPNGARAFPAYTMVTRGGAAAPVRVAIVGGTTPGAMIWDRDNLRGRLVVRDLVPEVRRAAAEARAAGADVVVCVVHSGFDEPTSYDTVRTGLGTENVTARIAREVPGLDLVVFGHSHRQRAEAVGDTFVLQPKNWAEQVGVAHLALVRDGGAGGRWRVASRRADLVPTAGAAEHAGVLAATERAHARAVAYAGSTLGTTPVAWRADSARVADVAITDLVLEVMRRAGQAELAATAAFSLDAGLDAGPITVAEVARLYPYENTLRVVRVTGAQLRAFLEHSARYYRGPGEIDRAVAGYNFDVVQGAEYVLDLSRPIGERVTALTVKGRPVGDADTFTLALNNYRQTGGGGFAMLADAPVVRDRGEEIRQLLIDEVRRRGTLRPDDYHVINWRLAPADAGARAYVAMRGDGTGRAAGAGSAGPAPSAAPVDTGGTRVTKQAARPAAVGARTLRILAINDFHGAFEPRADRAGTRRGGAGPLAATIARARAECRQPACVSLLIDGGDEFQGTPTSNLVYGRSVGTLFRALGVSAAALGNHEFDWGVDTLRARLRELPYAVLGANVRAADGSRLPWLRDDTLIVRDGLRIGVVGVADPGTPRTTKALNVRGLTFGPMAPAIDERTRALRARGAQVVIVTAHVGAFCDADGELAPGEGGTARSTPPASGPDTATAAGTTCRGAAIGLASQLSERVDAIVSGHTHSRVVAVVNGIPIVQGRSSGRALGIIDLPLGGGAPTVAVREVIADSAGAPPAEVAAIVRRAVAEVEARTSRRIAEIAEAMPREPDEQYALGNLVADAQRWAARTDVAIMNNGGIRTGLAAGTATFGALFEIQPFANTLYRVTVRGADLRAHLARVVSRDRPRWHVSGLTVTYDSTKTGEARLVGVTMADGRPLVDDRLYSVALNDFLVAGGDGLQLAERAASVTPTNLVDLDVFVGYLRQLPQPVRAPAEERIRPLATGAAR